MYEDFIETKGNTAAEFNAVMPPPSFDEAFDRALELGRSAADTKRIAASIVAAEQRAAALVLAGNDHPGGRLRGSSISDAWESLGRAEKDGLKLDSLRARVSSSYIKGRKGKQKFELDNEPKGAGFSGPEYIN